MTLETFAAAITGCGRGTVIGAATRLEPDPRQLVRLFQAGAIIALADETATAAALWEVNPPGEARPVLFQLTLQMSAKVIRNTDRGTLVAEVEKLHRGRSLTTVPLGVAAPVGPRGR